MTTTTTHGQDFASLAAQYRAQREQYPHTHNGEMFRRPGPGFEITGWVDMIPNWDADGKVSSVNYHLHFPIWAPYGPIARDVRIWTSRTLRWRRTSERR